MPFGFIKKGFSVVRKGVKLVSKVPGIKAIPVVGSVVAGAELVSTGVDFISGGNRSSAAPAAPALPPVLPQAARLPAIPRQTGGIVPFGTGARAPILPSFNRSGPVTVPQAGPVRPGGPSSVQNLMTAEALKQFAIPANALRTYFRAPPGFVIVRDANGQVFGVLKSIAKQAGIWKPSKKPPISVRQWSSLKRANSTVNKIKRINKMAKNVANFK